MTGTRPRGLTGPLLISGEDAPWITGALRLARLLAQRGRLNAHVLGVVRPPAFAVSILLPDDYQALEEGRRLQQLDRVRRRLYETVGLAAPFSTSAITGSPALILAQEARQRGSELILVGLEEHGAPGRTATEDAALQVTRAADVPVLAVPAGVHSLPRRALVAMDFSASNQRAASAVLPVLDAGATVTLAHVEPDTAFRDFGNERCGDIYARGVAGLFEQFKAGLSASGEVTVETVLLRGDDPAASLLDLARKGEFDVIASGMQSASALDHPLIGSVSTALLRGANCTTLIAPPPASA